MKFKQSEVQNQPIGRITTSHLVVVSLWLKKQPLKPRDRIVACNSEYLYMSKSFYTAEQSACRSSFFSPKSPYEG